MRSRWRSLITLYIRSKPVLVPFPYTQIAKMSSAALLEPHLPDTPGALLNQWIEDAKTKKVPLPTVASLASASLPSGRVSNRMVNVKDVRKDDAVCTLYSDFKGSKKAKDIANNPNVALTFYWQQTDRSVRLEGKIRLLSKEESRPYFASRSRDFQASVLLGEQSHPVEGGHEKLVEKIHQIQNQDGDLDIPDYWTGAEIVPDWVEFWQGNSDRVSDRIAYSFNSDRSSWEVERLSP